MDYRKSYNHGNFMNDYFDNGNIRIVNINYIKILYISSNNSFSDFNIIS